MSYPEIAIHKKYPAVRAKPAVPAVSAVTRAPEPTHAE